MAYSPVDPARLEGEALRRWYLRSPEEVEQERQAAKAQRYDEFFAITRPFQRGPLHEATGAQQPADLEADEILWTSANGHGNRWRGERVSQGYANNAPDQHRAMSRLDGGRRGQGVGDIGDCVSCHGRLAPPFPFPFPTWGTPSLRDAPASPPSTPPERDRKQCEIQLQRDTETCNQQPNNAAKAVCHGTASKRYAHCGLTGEVGEPDLFTIPRMPGRGS